MSLVSLTFAASAFLVALVLVPGASAQVNSTHPFPKYSYTHHPTHNLRRVRDYPTPVIMDSYFFRSGTCCDRFNSEGGMFAPASATYKFQDSADYFCVDADVLYTPATRRSGHNEGHFATIKLTRPAVVYVLLTVDDPFPAGTIDFTITSSDADVAVPADWTAIAAVEHETQADFEIGDVDRWTQTDEYVVPFLKRNAVAVEVTLSPENELLLAHPTVFRVNGERVRNALVVMAEQATFPLVGHPAPILPGNFNSYLTGETVRPADDPPFPNQSCPSWLHDTYIVKRDGAKWATWHPPIDPVYWCYFDHEHGGYPGLYFPRFHFTAYHTPDPSSPDGRQQESHNGFKVIPFVADDGRVVVMVLHAHNSQARRFHARHHTFVFSVHKANDDGSWDMEMELHMKADFGALRAINTGIFLPDQQLIQDEMDAIGQKAERDVYVFNEDTFPDNGIFWMSGGDNPALETALTGRYEEWRMPMNCGVNPQRYYNSGFKFEFHEQQTTMKYWNSTASDNLQRLNGDGMRRSVVFVASDGGHQETHVNAENCVFLNGTVDDRDNRGRFYTDAYFKYIVDPATYGDFAMKQYIKKPFETIVVGGHRAITNSDPWVGINKYSENMVPFFSNMEFAIKIMEN
eukprot:CAMPEP_0194026436 /NCGR_PEP_ID=MMETSP0009_2-20130614/732_1 /TAXON_ID=210454 /ORGANISM="Grammatophora oceanica, Strain CCMP 410" /LENGTH=630 /DNA_ID=CAMNT_0038665117 /DNA_START=83 /DNA_END=1978 /DNA_ORIENTATION=-